MTADISVVVTAHDETTVCGPTMRSADVAVARARDRGLVVETVVALDAPTEETAAYFAQERFDHWSRRLLGQNDLGLARNAVVPETSGRHLAFLDADDLFSENWLVEGFAALESAQGRGDRVIVHPELNVVFDAHKAVVVAVEQGSPLFTPHHLYFRHYYDSLCLVPREAHLEVPYAPRDIRRGLSYQDFQFTIETMAAGWRHVSARDTIIFKRRRDASLVTESNHRRAVVRSLAPMAIDRVRDLGASVGPHGH